MTFEVVLHWGSWRYCICLKQNGSEFGISGWETVVNNFHQTEPFHQLFGQALFFPVPHHALSGQGLSLSAKCIIMGTKNYIKVNWKLNCKQNSCTTLYKLPFPKQCRKIKHPVRTILEPGKIFWVITVCACVRALWVLKVYRFYQIS